MLLKTPSAHINIINVGAVNGIADISSKAMAIYTHAERDGLEKDQNESQAGKRKRNP